MIYDDPRPITLRADDQPAPDLQSLHVEMAELLDQAEQQLAAMLAALGRQRDLIDAVRLARLWGDEALANVRTARETRETIAREERAAGLMAMPWEAW